MSEGLEGIGLADERYEGGMDREGRAAGGADVFEDATGGEEVDGAVVSGRERAGLADAIEAGEVVAVEAGDVLLAEPGDCAGDVVGLDAVVAGDERFLEGELGQGEEVAGDAAGGVDEASAAFRGEQVFVDALAEQPHEERVHRTAERGIIDRLPRGEVEVLRERVSWAGRHRQGADGHDGHVLFEAGKILGTEQAEALDWQVVIRVEEKHQLALDSGELT